MYDPFDFLKSLNIDNLQKQPLLTRVMEYGKRMSPQQSPGEIAQFTHKQLQKLPEEYKRFENPHLYKVGLTGALHDLRNQLIQDYKILTRFV